MSTYLNRAYGAANYAKFRPTYPPSLFKYILDFHNRYSGRKPGVEFAVDVACGPGQATKELGSFSAKVLGIDHSAGMIEQANKKNLGSKFEFKVSSDRGITGLLEPHTVDLLTAAQGAHWFAYPEFWTDAATVLRPGGTLAIWGYWTFGFPDYPAVASIIDDFAYSAEQCGPFWDEGRKILDEGYKTLEATLPRDLFANVEYSVNRFDDTTPNQPFDLVRHDMPVAAVDSMLRTWSSYFNFKQAHPDRPDPVDLTMARIKEETGLGLDDLVTVKWNTVYLLATRKTLYG